MSFGNSWSNLCSYTSVLLIITLCFTCGERKIYLTIKKSHNMNMIVWFLSLFMSLLTVIIVMNRKQRYYSWNLLYLSKKPSWTNLERVSIPNLDLSEKIGKIVWHLSSKTNFSAFLQIHCSNFRLNLCKRSQSLSNESNLKGSEAG